MQERPVLRHSSFVKDAVLDLPVRFGLAFGAACCQRLLPLIASNEAAADPGVPGEYLGKVWRWLSDLDDAPGDWSEAFEEFLPSGDVAEEGKDGDQSALLFHGLAGCVAQN